MLKRLIEGPGIIAYVVDRFGGLSGLVSLEDVVETLLGLESVDESDSVEDLQQLAREAARNRNGQLNKPAEGPVPINQES